MRTEYIELAESLARYILEFEDEDFTINPSENHIYYVAQCLVNGKEEADRLLKEAKENE